MISLRAKFKKKMKRKTTFLCFCLFFLILYSLILMFLTWTIAFVPTTSKPIAFVPTTSKLIKITSPELIRINEHILTTLQSLSEHEDELVPWFQSNEDLVFFRIVMSRLRPEYVIEFGCGGSTYHINLLPSVKRIFSIEPTSEWVTALYGKPTISLSASLGRIQFVQPKYGPIGDHGFPPEQLSQYQNSDKKHPGMGTYSVPEGYYDLWSRYPNIILDLDPTTRSNIDFAFVDGRFRVCCVASLLLHTNVQFILMDDYGERMAHKRKTGECSYVQIEKFLDDVDHAVELHLFKRKEGIDRNELQTMFQNNVKCLW